MSNACAKTCQAFTVSIPQSSIGTNLFQKTLCNVKFGSLKCTKQPLVTTSVTGHHSIYIYIYIYIYVWKNLSLRLSTYRQQGQSELWNLSGVSILNECPVVRKTCAILFKDKMISMKQIQRMPLHKEVENRHPKASG